jgi:hypothetical protein
LLAIDGAAHSAMDVLRLTEIRGLRGGRTFDVHTRVIERPRP